jgi:Na+/proline symporter
MDFTLGQSLKAMGEKGYSKIFFTDPTSKFFFLKQIAAGAFITITMTGMDQEMMQKNISVKRLKDAQKNVITLSLIMLAVILLFLVLGGLLHLYAEQQGVTATGDALFPTLALQHMPPVISAIFIIALISALFPSADGAITALTSSFCIDIMDMQRRQDWDDKEKKRYRQTVHLTFAAIFLLFVMVFYWINNKSMIDVILSVASYTYGPLLGLFSFGILTKKPVNDRLVPVICVLAPLICLVVDKNQALLFESYRIGPELLILNGLLTFVGLLIISKKQPAI